MQPPDNIAPEPSAYESLSSKHRRFLDLYLEKGFNITAAYRETYNTSSDVAAASNGNRLIRNDRMQAALRERMKALSMPSEEVIYRLTEQARNPQMRYLNADGSVDLEGLIRDGLAHLVKGTRYDSKGNLVIEFHDVQAALRDIGKSQGIFRESYDLKFTDPVRIIDFEDDDESDDDD